ncbi:MAG: transaldolase [Acidobacteriota bacterium]
MTAPHAFRFSLPEGLQEAVEARLAAWDTEGGTRRIWDRDASVWTGRDEASWLGWIGIASQQLESLPALLAFQASVREGGFTHALLMGMGGSSLAPEVWRETFGVHPGFPELHVLDSTDPAQIRAIESRLDLRRTLFIVSSKSGSTLEPNIFKAYFFDRARAVLGAEAARRFVAVTDPGSALEREARADGFLEIFAGRKSIGGRYSALSSFGMVPAAAMGLDVRRMLASAQAMHDACAPGVAAARNPGLALGTVLGVAASQGIDKVTIVTSPGIHDLGAWLEQLLAESTGKIGKGLVPVDREKLGSVDRYGGDRLFAYVRLESAPDAAQDAAIDALERAGRPVARLPIALSEDLGAEMFRWEVATAAAGAVLGINPFDQPDVEASKVATRALTDAYERDRRAARGGAAPGGRSAPEADRGPEEAPRHARGRRLPRDPRLPADERAHRDGAPGDAPPHPRRAPRRDVPRVRPRFLHSTGQAYKGGPNSGVFLQVTCDDPEDLPIPGRRATFGVVKAAQARGDLAVLLERGRRALRIHLGPDLERGLHLLGAALTQALS